MSDQPENQKQQKRRGRIWLWIGLGILALLLVGYLAVGAVAADKLTLPERKVVPGNNPGRLGLEYEDVLLPARDGKAEIAAWFIPAEGAEQAVILVHGRDASRSDAILGHWVELAAGLQRAGLSVLMIDLRGHGESSAGRFTFGLQERYDVLGALDWLESRGFQPGKIGVLGLSLGAASSVGAAAESTDIGAVVTDSGFSELSPLVYAGWEQESGLPLLFIPATRLMARLMYGIDVFDARPVAELEAISPRPLLLIHCTTDSMVPVAMQQEMAAAAPWAETWTVPDCEHTHAYLEDPVAYEQRVAEFFRAGLK
jgi:uncharacterized protein